MSVRHHHLQYGGPPSGGAGAVSLHPLQCHLQKFSDDSAIVGFIFDRELTQDFTLWCQRNNVQLHTGKTKELVWDFRRRRHSPPHQ